MALIVNPSGSEPAQLTQLVFAVLDVARPDLATDYILKLLDNEEVLEGMFGVNKPPNFNLEVCNLIPIGNKNQIMNFRAWICRLSLIPWSTLISILV